MAYRLENGLMNGCPAILLKAIKSEQHSVGFSATASDIAMSKSQRVSKILEHRFPGWLAAAVILILIFGIKFMTS